MHPTARLSDYLDDELTPAERLEVDHHLIDCTSCRTALDGLRDVVTSAAAFEDEPPGRDLWPALRATLRPAEPRTRRISLSIPEALAAGVLLAVVSGLCVWLFFDRRVDAGLTAGTAGRAAVQSATPVNLTDQTYDRAVEDLTRLLAAERGRLAPKTVAIIERDLAAIDRAIAEARQALATDPSNPFLNGHLAQQRRTKIALLRQANQLARAGL